MRPTTHTKDSRKINALLWSVQCVLALLFLFGGGMKLVLPIATLTQQGGPPLPGLFLRFIGVLEVAGALGMVLPGLLHLRAELTPLAAAGLVIVMSGATGVTLASGAAAGALVPVAVGFLAAFVAYGRWRLVPLSRRASLHPTVLRSAA